MSDISGQLTVNTGRARSIAHSGQGSARVLFKLLQRSSWDHHERKAGSANAAIVGGRVGIPIEDRRKWCGFPSLDLVNHHANRELSYLPGPASSQWLEWNARSKLPA